MSTQQTQVKLYKSIPDDCKKFNYKDPVVNKYKSVTVYVQESATSTRRPRYQLTSHEETRLKCPYGISEPFEDSKKNDSRKSLDISIDNPDLKAALLALDEHNKQVAFENCERWFKRPMPKEQIAFMYQSLVRPDRSGKGYTETVRTKVTLDNSERATRFFTLIENPDGSVSYRQEKSSIIKNGSRIIPIIEVGSLWFTSKQFGMTLECTDVIVFPSTERGAFDFVGFSVKPMDTENDTSNQPQKSSDNPISDVPAGFAPHDNNANGATPMDDYQPPSSPHQ